MRYDSVGLAAALLFIAAVALRDSVAILVVVPLLLLVLVLAIVRQAIREARGGEAKSDERSNEPGSGWDVGDGGGGNGDGGGGNGG